MSAGNPRRGPRPRRGWGETVRHIPPPPPPEGIDLVIEKTLIDDHVIARNRQLREEEREAQSDLDDLADTFGDLTRPDRDHLGRVVVDWRYALVGALVVAIVAGAAFWLVYVVVTAPPATT